MYKNVLQRVFFTGLSALFFHSCGDGYKTVHEQFVIINKADLKDDTLIEDPRSHTFFSRLRKPSSFGRMFVYKVPEEDQGKEFYLVFSGKIRTNYAQSNSTITVVAHDKDNKQLCWRSVFLKSHYTETNQWCYFTDAIKIEPDIDGKAYADITCVAYLAASPGEIFDMDTLHVTVKQSI